MSNEVDDKLKQEIMDLIFQGRKIQAIKLFRESSGVGLKEAKDFIDPLTEELFEKHPEKFTVKPGTGCVSSILIIIAIFAVYYC